LKKEFFVREGLKVYEQKNAIYSSVDLGEYYIDESKFKELKRFEIKEGDFILSCSGTIGRIYQIPNRFEKGIINQALLIIRLNPDRCFPKYFYYQFVSDLVQNKVIDDTQGGAMKNLVGMSEFRKAPIFLPPTLTEQKEIANALSDVDALIRSLEKLISKKKAIKQGAMQELLTPKCEWEKVQVKDISIVGRGRVISHKEIDQSKNKTYPVYSSQTTNDGIMGYIDTFDFEGEYISWTTDGEKAGTVFYRNGRFNCTNVCGTIKLKKDNAKFVSYLLGTIAPKKVSKNLANPKLMNDPMKRITLFLPNITDQIRISKILSDMDLEIEVLVSKKEKYHQIKQGMMQELLTGKTRLV
jgi:type I restriction enzyme S subunit